MQELTRVFNNINIPVEIQDENNMWFDVSSINKEMKVNFLNWKNNKQTKKLLSLINGRISLKRPLIDDEVYGKNFIHRKMFISYARFISVEFEAKADEIIMDLLMGDKILCQQETKQLQLENKQIQKQLEISQKETIEAKRKIYAYPRNNGFETVTRIIEDYAINITAHDLNEILAKHGLLQVEIIEIKKYKSLNMQGVIPLVRAKTVINILDKEGIERGLGYIDTHPSLPEFKK